MILSQDLKEFIELLNDHDVRYLVIGGVAVAFHGYPRYTKDLDIWLEINPENAARVIQVLRAFGFESLGLDADDFLEEDTVIQLGYPPNRIDLIMGASGVNFEACYRDKIEVEIEGIKVNFIDLENLKKNKKASGRLQDLADIENLK
jgi:predicted nucleotidyltransferase